MKQIKQSLSLGLVLLMLLVMLPTGALAESDPAESAVPAETDEAVAPAPLEELPVVFIETEIAPAPETDAVPDEAPDEADASQAPEDAPASEDASDPAAAEAPASEGVPADEAAVEYAAGTDLTPALPLTTDSASASDASGILSPTSAAEEAGVDFELPVPKLKSLESVSGGMKLTWEAVSGAPKYAVLRKSGDIWIYLEVLSDTEYTDASAVSGQSYTYTVRCMGSDEKTLLSMYDTDGITATHRLSGWQKIDGEWYYFNDDGLMTVNGWAKDSKGWMWLGDDGSITKNQWVLVGGEWYFLKADGYMAAREWTRDNGGWYWMNASGKIAKNVWAKDNGGWYWMNGYGRIAKNVWAKDSGGWYWMNSVGRIATNVWAKDSGGWYWMNGSGRIATNVWAKDSKGWCWMDGNGRITTSKWIKYKNNWYYLKADGYMAASEWVSDSSGPCWLTASGRMAASEWVESDGAWYYVNAGGHKVTGTQTIGGKTYVFDSDGKWTVTAPKLKDVQCAPTGLTVSWEAVTGADHYAVLRKTGGSWTVLSVVGSTSFTDTSVPSGVDVTYTVRCVDRSDNYAGPYDESGKTVSATQIAMNTKAQGYTSSTSWLILTDTAACRTAIFKGSKGNWQMQYFWLCTPGAASTPTIKGTYTVTGYKMYSFTSYGSLCYYATQFSGNYLFHSITYSPSDGSVQDDRLGMNLSHGCIRLATANAKWIYDNIPTYTKVVTY